MNSGRGPGWGPINFEPGYTVTLQSPSWVGQVVTADLSWEADTGDERINGTAPAGEVGVGYSQWNGDLFPLNGVIWGGTTSSGAFSKQFTGFDVRDGGHLNLYYFNPATDYVTNLQGWLHSLQVVAPWAASGYTPQDGEALTAWLYDDLGTLLASTGDDRDESPNAYWFDDFGVYDIQPGYWVTVTGGSGWSAGVQVPAMTIQGDHESDLVSGEARSILNAEVRCCASCSMGTGMRPTRTAPTSRGVVRWSSCSASRTASGRGHSSTRTKAPSPSASVASL